MNRQYIAKYAKYVVRDYLDKGVLPIKSIVKIAKEHNLSDDWIARLSETVNVSLHQGIREKVGSSMIQFDLVDPSEVISKLSSTSPDPGESVGSIMTQVSEIEKGMAKAAADEFYHNLDKKVRGLAENSGMSKTASEKASNALFQEKAIAFQKEAERVKSTSKIMVGDLSNEMQACIMKLARIALKEGYPSRVAGAVGSMRKSAVAAFPDNEDAVNTIVDMVKESSSVLAEAGEDVPRENLMMKEGTSAHGIISDIIAKAEDAKTINKIAYLIEEDKVDILAETESDLQDKIEKVAVLAGVAKNLVKKPTNALFAYMGVKEYTPSVKRDMSLDLGEPDIEEEALPPKPKKT